MDRARKFGIALVVLAIAAGISIRAQEKPTVVKGYVLDSSCAFVKDLKKPVSRECALQCAKAGSQLVILADDGTIYWPISDSLPATGQNQRLMEFAGQKVTAKGKMFEKGGSRAIVIEHIEAAPAPK
jgi:hypothetical protein